jgi:hypothetical protein
MKLEMTPTTIIENGIDTISLIVKYLKLHASNLSNLRIRLVFEIAHQQSSSRAYRVEPYSSCA